MRRWQATLPGMVTALRPSHALVGLVLLSCGMPRKSPAERLPPSLAGLERLARGDDP